MTADEYAACGSVGGCVSALRRMPLAARAQLEAESDALLALLARGRQVAGSGDEVSVAIRSTEELVATIKAELLAARL